MQDDKKNDYAPNLVQKIKMWLMCRKMIKQTEKSIRHGKLTIVLYRSLAQRAGSTGLESAKKDKSDIDMKTSQVEASLLQEYRSLDILRNIDISDPELYEPITN